MVIDWRAQTDTQKVLCLLSLTQLTTYQQRAPWCQPPCLFRILTVGQSGVGVLSASSTEVHLGGKGAPPLSLPTKCLLTCRGCASCLVALAEFDGMQIGFVTEGETSLLVLTHLYLLCPLLLTPSPSA